MIGLMLIALLQIACGALVPTPIPTPAFAPEKSIVVHSIWLDGVVVQGVIGSSTLYPESGYRLLAAFYEWPEVVSVEDMNWTLWDQDGNESEPIGFGMPLPNRRLVLMTGYLQSENCHPLPFASNTDPFTEPIDPLFALVFLVPDGATSVTILSGQGQQFNPLISDDWLPTRENGIEVVLEADCIKEWDPRPLLEH